MNQRALPPLVNVPNVLTAARLVLALGLFAAAALHRPATALVLFIVAASTDWLDGYWARRFQQVTQFGRIFDPFVDKVIVCGAFIFLAAEPGSGVAPWVAVLVTARELLVTALRGYVEQSGGDFSASWAGKWKMVLQCGAATAAFGQLAAQPDPPGWLSVLTAVLVWLAVLATVYSGADYLVAAARFARARRAADAERAGGGSEPPLSG